MTEPSTEQPDPATIARPRPVPTDYRGGEHDDFLKAINTLWSEEPAAMQRGLHKPNRLRSKAATAKH